MKILAIIPARGGSKGIKRKNLVDVCGRPLIAWSLDVGKELLRLGFIDRCVVSTDDKEIAIVAKKIGGDVPFLRPASAATDGAKSIEYVLHAVNYLTKSDGFYDAVMILQPTSPIRDIKSLSDAIYRFRQSNSSSMISCYQEDYINDLVMYDDNFNGTLKPRNIMHNKGVRRQEHGPVMVRNGALYITRVPYLSKTKKLICDNPMFWEMSKNNSVDVDTQEDLLLLRALMCQK